MTQWDTRTPGVGPAAAVGLAVRLAKLVPSGATVLLMLGHLPGGGPHRVALRTLGGRLGVLESEPRAQQSGLCLRKGQGLVPKSQAFLSVFGASSPRWPQRAPFATAIQASQGAGADCVVNLSAGSPCWLLVDFLPKCKQGIQGPDPPPAFFLVESPFPPGRGQKNQFPGSLPAWEWQSGVGRVSLAVQEGDLGAWGACEDRAGPGA
uniref:Uncharacterized protein n=1 Tax=Myotis myotis TaxID=51298 RepID=A0A7J7RHJ2_MYOMY|nr:hypothetical protein mMyoMyo1_010303 [Myotis myotis]